MSTETGKATARDTPSPASTSSTWSRSTCDTCASGGSEVPSDQKPVKTDHKPIEKSGAKGSQGGHR